MMICSGIHLSLREDESVELCEVDMPVRARIQVGRRGSAIIDNVDNAIVGGNPWEERRSSRGAVNRHGRRPGIALVGRASEADGMPIGPHGVEVAGDRVDGQSRKEVS